ncbi:hypothetical protein V8E36_002292 [Tilletia maclaganii]
MSGFNGSVSAHLGPPSPSSPGSPTTPTSLVPASRDFLVPIGSTGALQKFSVANAAQKRKAAADRRAQAHIAAAQAGWSTLETNSVGSQRAASSLGTNHSTHTSSSPGGYGSSRGLAGSLAPVDVHHRPSSASAYAPRSATISSSAHMSVSSGSRPELDPRAQGHRMRTTSTSAMRTSGSSSNTHDSPNGSYRHHPPPPPAHPSTPSMHSTQNTGSHSPSLDKEKKRGFGKGLRGLFSSSSSRKASVSSASSGPHSGSPQQQQQSTSSSGGLWSSSNTSSPSPYGSGFSPLSDSPETSFDRDHWSSSSSASRSHLSSGHDANALRAMGNRSTNRQPRASILGTAVPGYDVSGAGGRRESANTRGGTESQLLRAHTSSRAREVEAETKRALLVSHDPFTNGSRSHDDPLQPALTPDSYNSNATPPVAPGSGGSNQSGSSSNGGGPPGSRGQQRRQSIGPPQLEFDLPSPGFSFEEHERSPLDAAGQRSPRRRTSGSEQGQEMGALSPPAPQHSTRVRGVAQQRQLTLDSLAPPSASSALSAAVGGSGHNADLGGANEPPSATSWRSSSTSTASIEFTPGPNFGKYSGEPGDEAGSAPRPPVTSPPAPTTPTTAKHESPQTTPANWSRRGSISSPLSQATSIVAMTNGWQVEPDYNPPPHPSTLYSQNPDSSVVSLHSQDQQDGPHANANSRRTSASMNAPSDGRTSQASTVGRSNAATPLGRPYSATPTQGLHAPPAEGQPGTFGPGGSPNPLLAPLFENFAGSGSGTDDGSSSGQYRSRHGSFDSGTHGHSTLGHGTHGHSTIGHGTLGHGTPASLLLNRSVDESSGGQHYSSSNGTGGGSPAASAQGHQSSSGSSWASASSGGHSGRPARRPGSSGNPTAAAAAAGGASSASGGATTTKSGRPTTPRGGVAASAEQPPSALRTAPASLATRTAGQLTTSSLTGATRLEPAFVGSETGTLGSASGAAQGAAGVVSANHTALRPKSRDRLRAETDSPSSSIANSTIKESTLNLTPADPAMLATLAKLENAGVGSTAGPLNAATFDEAKLRNALANGSIDSNATSAREGASHEGSQGGQTYDLSSTDSSPSQGMAAGAAKLGILNGVVVPEGADPKTYVPPNALTRTRRGARVGAAAKVVKEPTVAATVTRNGRGQGRFSLDSDDDDERDGEESQNGKVSGDPVVPADATPAAGATGVELPSPSNDEEDLSSVDGLASDEDDSELEQLSASGSRSGFGSGVESRASSSGRGGTPAVDSQVPVTAWTEVEIALKRFRDESVPDSAGSTGDVSTPGSNDKGSLLRTVLLPFLALEAETPNVEVRGISKFTSGKARRGLFFKWIRSLLVELQQTQTSADRGAILESIGCVLESRNLAAKMLERDAADLEEFNSIFGVILGWAVGELNKKGVYQNTLIFTGRLLAIAFFRIPGVASKLLRALPVNRFALERISSEANWDLTQPRSFERYRKRFPNHLQEFCFQDTRTYLKMLDGQTPLGLSDQDADDDRFLVRQDEVEVEMAGNWLRRWQSDDSELFFSFIRSYHRQMSTLLMSSRRLRRVSKWYFGGPGYAHLATSVHQKCLSMVHREIFSVTTLSSQKTFNPGDTANVLSGSTAGKPRQLEAANRRCTAIVVEIARSGNPNNNTQLFSGMLAVHVKSVVKRTSLYDAEGVFCLLDWLDGIISHMDAADLPVDSWLDISFLIEMVSMLLHTADHALALMRTIAFCYSNFAVLTGHKDTRLRFCERILLDPSVFHKLFLSWSVTIRAYFLHLLVFRLARISDFPNPKADPNGKTAVRVARLFNQRLDEIRRRYEELAPSVPTDTSDEDGDEFSRFKNRPSSFVSTIKHTPSLHRQETMSKAERILGIGVPDPALAGKAGADTGKVPSLAAKWLRGLGSKGKKSRWSGSKAAVGLSEGDSPTINNEPRRKMLALDELELDDSEVDESDTDTADEVGGAVGSSKGAGSSTQGVNGADDSQTAPAVTAPETTALAAEPEIGLGDHITPDASFDLQSGGPPLAAGPGRPGTSPRVSRAFSKRSSILPGPAFELVGEDADGEAPPVPAVPLQSPYDKHLHTYAVQSLTEYERTIQHDQYFAAQPENEKAQVPRLQVRINV